MTTSTAGFSASMSTGRRPHIALVLFDAFDTLVTPRIPPHAQYEEEARKHGLGQYLDARESSICEGSISRMPIKDAFKASFKQLAKQYPLYGLHTGLQSSDEWWTMLIEQTMLRSGVPEKALDEKRAELALALLRRFASKEAYELVPGAIETLQSLSKVQSDPSGLRENAPLALSMATNSDSRILEACKSLGLGEYLDLDVTYDEARPPTEVTETHPQKGNPQTPSRRAVSGPTLSYDVGFEKPDARFFHSAVQRAFPKSDAELSLDDMCRHTLYVGDSYGEDYIGATQAGLQAVWLQREQDNVTRKDGEPPILTARALGDVVRIVRETQSTTLD